MTVGSPACSSWIGAVADRLYRPPRERKFLELTIGKKAQVLAIPREEGIDAVTGFGNRYRSQPVHGSEVSIACFVTDGMHLPVLRTRALTFPRDLPPEVLLEHPTRPAQEIAQVIGKFRVVALDELTEADRAEGLDVRYQPRPRRFETIEEGLAALEAGDLDAFVASPQELEAVLNTYPGLAIAGGLTEEAEQGFVMGTNQIGQDIFSRIIWGTRIALIVGLLSAAVAVAFGVASPGGLGTQGGLLPPGGQDGVFTTGAQSLSGWE